MYSPKDLAYYDRGKRFPDLIIDNVNSSLAAVLFPKMAGEQTQQGRIKLTTRNSIKFSSYVMCPMMLGLAAVAEPFVRVLLTEKWIECVPLLRLFCVVCLFYPIHTANMQAIKAVGKSDIYLKLEIVKKCIELVVLLTTIWVSVKAMVIGMVVCNILFTFVNAYPNIKLLNYGFKEQMSDILPNITMSLIMFLCVSLIGFLPINNFLLLSVQIIVGLSLYIILSVITKSKEFKYIKNMVLSKITKREG